jgi:hypothetical protein
MDVVTKHPRDEQPACNDRAARRSLSQPGELIYIWRDWTEGYLNGPRLLGFIVADEEELQANNVNDLDIVSVWRDGEEVNGTL